MAYLLAILLYVWLARPVLADFAAAEQAERRGDSGAAFHACKAAADAGDAHCQNQLGLLYERGLGVAQDYAEAIRLFRLAAAQGLAAAELNLGVAYQFGRGVPKDPAEAARWYRMAADRGDAAAQNNLAFFYAIGSGVPRNAALALDLFRRSAESGHLPAIFNLAQALDGGVATPRDPLGAYLWYSIGARLSSDPGGRDKAARARDRLAAEIPTGELAAARSAAERWKPGEGDPRAGLAAPLSQQTSSGSGFIVSRAGDVLTSGHVIEGCREIQVMRDGKSLEATLVAKDQAADLAILRLPAPIANVAVFRGDGPVKPGETAVVVGYPLQGLLTSEASVTAGIVSALEGPHNDRRQLQITAPVQPGNSGGPLVDASGAVIGVVVSKLNALRIAEATGAVPENVNFAVNARYAQALLERNGVKYDIGTRNETLPMPTIAERALKYTVMVRCVRP